MPNLVQLSTAILAGGLGTRLRSVVSDRPKVLAQVLGRPFLAFLLDQLADAGVGEVVLCTQHLSEKIEETFGDRYKTLRLVYSREETPLGTGGALRKAFNLFSSDRILVMNGDSYIPFDLKEYFAWFGSKEQKASLLLARVSDSSRFGQVEIDSEGVILGFQEKGSQGRPGWINAGVYILKTQILESIPSNKFFSLERELFPSLVGKGLYGFKKESEFIDIGTPEAYEEAETFFSEMVSHR
jgi:D-glycero-alpha-D-manno-heptose 1-phosphate guanylyltransferase